MASAAPPKKMVSSVFITLSSPHRATVTPQQRATPPAHSGLAKDKQPNESAPASRRRKDNSTSPGGVDTRDQARPQSLRPGLGRRAMYEDDDGGAAAYPPPTPPAPAPAPAPPSSLRAALPEESALPPPLPPPPSTPPPHLQTLVSPPLTEVQQPAYGRETDKDVSSLGSKHGPQTQVVRVNDQDQIRESREVCGFCRKPVALSEPAIQALNRTYHEGCFQCRSCHVPLAGKQYYNKAGIPLCDDCYQASLELCWACGDIITDHVIRALERPYHPFCFTCTTCKQQIGEQSFAQGEVGEVYCLQDYYRKYAPQCHCCNQLIIPKEDGTDSYTVECLGRSYHENCYRCEVCVIQLYPEPNERGCYPLDGRLLCKACHVKLVSGQH